jgi:hypothetical protein
VAIIVTGSNTPGQKKEAGRGVTVNSHTVARATRLDEPDMYAIVRVMSHVRSGVMNLVSNSLEYGQHPPLNDLSHLFLSSMRSRSPSKLENRPRCARDSDQAVPFVGTKPMSNRMKSHPVELYNSRRQAQVTSGARKRGYHPNRQRQCRHNRQQSIQPGLTSLTFLLPIFVPVCCGMIVYLCMVQTHA